MMVQHVVKQNIQKQKNVTYYIKKNIQIITVLHKEKKNTKLV